jgi:micrococcal nuclease
VRFVALVLVLVSLAACGGGSGDSAPAGQAVERVIDGDTIVLASGERVRLVQIDTPELDGDECYAREAADDLGAMLPPGTAITLEADPRLDQVDRYGRLLRYVHRDGTNVNLELVRRGAASVWFFDGDRGRYAGRLLAAARDAKAAQRGLWGACPGTPLDPEAGVDTGR